jgi:curli biogenesis system outer membrane secretion channel CsgG
MRMHRIVIAVLSFCLVGLVPFVAASSATAAEPAAKAAGTIVEKAALPARKVKFQFKAQAHSSYKFYGKVQGAKNKKITLLHSKSKKGKYRSFKSGRTNARGNYIWQHLKATGWFYVKVPSDSKYATSYSQLIHVYYE